MPVCLKTCCLLLASGSVFAAPLTWPEALRLAQEHNPAFRSVPLEVEAAQGRADQARLWPNPELELSAEELPLTQGGLGQAKTLIGIAQTVPFPGKKTLETRIGRQQVAAAAAQGLARQRELVRGLAGRFQRTLAAQQKTAVAAELVQLATTLSDTIGKQVAAGAAAEPEQLRASLEQERAALGLSAARRELAEAQRDLAQWLGQPGSEIGPLAGALAETATAPLAAAAHPELVAAAADRQRAELELERARREPWPDITVGLAGGRDQAGAETLVELRVAVPLPLFDRAQGRRREARALAGLARLDLAATEHRLATQWHLALARLRAAQEQADSYRTRILPKATTALGLVRAGYEAGKFGLLDLLDTQRTLAEARLDYLDKLLELNLARADLEALAGTTAGTNP